MAVKALIFGTDMLFPRLQPHYDKQVQAGNLEITGYVDATKEDDFKIFSTPDFKEDKIVDKADFNYVIVSTQDFFYSRMKFLESRGLPRKNIIDGRIFTMSNFDFPRFLKEGIVYGSFPKNPVGFNIRTPLYKMTFTVGKNVTVTMGVGSNIEPTTFNAETPAEVSVGNFSDISWSQVFELGLNANHNYKNVVSSYKFGWKIPPNFFQGSPKDVRKIIIGNDVWIGCGCRFKSDNPGKPLTIGDGAVIASDSVVVEDVPPYAIVGGNPAKVIKYRFSKEIIEALLRIQWWNWDLDKINENFKYYHDIEKFVAANDPKLQQPKPAPKVEPKPAPKVEPKPAPKVEPKPAPKVELKPVPKVELKPAPKVEPQPVTKVEQPKSMFDEKINSFSKQEDRLKFALDQLKFG